MRRTNNHHWPSIIIAKYHGNEERQPGSMGRKRPCFVGERREQIHAIQTNIDIDTDTAPISTINDHHEAVLQRDDEEEKTTVTVANTMAQCTVAPP